MFNMTGKIFQDIGKIRPRKSLLFMFAWLLSKPIYFMSAIYSIFTNDAIKNLSDVSSKNLVWKMGSSIFIPHCLKEVETGVYWFLCLSICPSVCPSVCGQNHVRSVTSTILARSISYLHVLLSNLRRCVACEVFCKILGILGSDMNQ